MGFDPGLLPEALPRVNDVAPVPVEMVERVMEESFDPSRPLPELLFLVVERRSSPLREVEDDAEDREAPAAVTPTVMGGAGCLCCWLRFFPNFFLWLLEDEPPEKSWKEDMDVDCCVKAV